MKSILVTGVLVLSIAAASAAQRAATSARAALPPVSMTCPHHPDVLESRPGTCPICKMALVPVRIDAAWMCPVHSMVMSDTAGNCRLCRRALIPVSVSVTFTCLAQPGIDRLEPGTCPDGTPTVPRRTLRPHGNHNPQHGGQFFMSPDNWHHLEGTYPRSRVFRLYLYDDYARPLGAREMRRVQARVVTKETYDAATRRTTELAAFPMRVSGNGAYLEARVDAAALPAEMTAKVRFTPDGPEHRFDFTFTATSKEPPRPAVRRAATAAAATPPAPVPMNTEAAAAPAPGSVEPRTAPAPGDAPIPPSMNAIVAELGVRSAEIDALIREGNFGAVWVPAFRAKDLAVALEPHVAHLSPDARAAAERALQQVVRTAWLLDSFGDVGNRRQVEAAYAAFRAAADDVARTFGAVP
jgi:hypothetical protein